MKAGLKGRFGRTDDVTVGTVGSAVRSGDDVLQRVLDHPRAAVVAIAADGILVPLPASLNVPADRRLAVPPNRATMLDLVETADAMMVITAWEQARNVGFSVGTVHGRGAPEHPLTLTFVDASERHGVFVGALHAGTDEKSESLGTLENVFEIPRRPRTATIFKSVTAGITGVDERTTKMLGWAAEKMVGLRSLDFIHPEDQQRAIANWLELLAKQESQRVRLRHRCSDGRWLWVELENFYKPNEDPAKAVVTTQLSDISDEMAAHEALGQQERLLRRMTDALPLGVLQLSADRSLVYANSRLHLVLGETEVTSLEDVLALVVTPERQALDEAFDQALAGAPDTKMEVRFRYPGSAALRVCAVNLISLSSREGAPGALACFSDITDSARLRDELEVKATFDVLTGCHNRASILTILDQVLDQADGLTALIFLDLDRFKPINDEHGHAAGDELLIHVVNQLRGVLRQGDSLGRIGGDEFLLVAQNVSSPAAALAIGHRAQAALGQPAVLSFGPVQVGASIGIACSAPGIDGAALTRRADAAMYAAKQDRDLGPVLFDLETGMRPGS